LRSSKSGFVKRFEKTAGPLSRLPTRKTNISFLSKIKKNFLYIEAKRQTKSTFLVQRRMKHRKWNVVKTVDTSHVTPHWMLITRTHL
jgi:hypothetical protein